MVNVLCNATNQLVDTSTNQLIDTYNNNMFVQNCVYKFENTKNEYNRPVYAKITFLLCRRKVHLQNTQIKIEDSNQ